MQKQLKISIFQEHLEYYRLQFFNELHRLLSEAGMEMTLWVHESKLNSNHRAMPYVRYLEYYRFCGLVWERLPKQMREADLIIMPQQARYLALLACLLWRRLRGKMNAFWGHGRRSDPAFEKRWSEKLKRWFSVRVDWWFAYNELSARHVEELGFPAERIASVMNSTDTIELRNKLQKVNAEGLEIWRARLGVGPGPVGVFTGRLVANKRVEFTLAAALEIRKAIPTFEMIFIGDGEDRSIVEAAISRHSWIHCPGAKNNADKVPYWALADVLMNPGAVGLVINDAMALGLPTITTNIPSHGPEIDYLRDGINGVITSPWEDVDRFADATVQLLQNPSRLAAMKAAAFEDGNDFSAEIMAANFAKGIVTALNASV